MYSLARAKTIYRQPRSRREHRVVEKALLEVPLKGSCWRKMQMSTTLILIVRSRSAKSMNRYVNRCRLCRLTQSFWTSSHSAVTMKTQDRGSSEIKQRKGANLSISQLQTPRCRQLIALAISIRRKDSPTPIILAVYHHFWSASAPSRFWPSL